MSQSGRSTDPHDLRAMGKFIQAGRVHESRHELDEAIEAYFAAEAWQEAARLLSFRGRFWEAGMTLLRSLPERPTPVIRISPEVRRDAMNAALCFARGGARREAVGLLVNLGEHQRAAGLLSMAGMREEAVRAMRGEHIEGSPWPPGILFDPGASSRSAQESGPEWSRRPVSSTPSAASDPAPWDDSGHASDDSKSPLISLSGSEPASSSAPTPDGPVATVARSQTAAYLTDTPSPETGWAEDSLSHGPSTYSESLEFRPLGLTPSDPEPPAAAEAPGAAPQLSRRPRPLSRPSSPLTAMPQPGRPASTSVPGMRAPGRLRRGTPGSLMQQELASFLATDPSDRSHPIAVNRVIELVWSAELLAARVTRFLDEYLNRASSGELPPSAHATLYALGRLFEFHDRIDGAKLAYRTLLNQAPSFADAKYRTEQIGRGLAEAVGGTWQPVHLLIDGLHKFSPLPEFEDMPVLGQAHTGAVAAPPRGSLDRDMPPPAGSGSMEAEETLDFAQYADTSAQNLPDSDLTVSRESSLAPQSLSAANSREPSEEDSLPSSLYSHSGLHASYGGTGSYTAETDADGVIVPETIIANRYRIEDHIGSGGMAHVYRARDLELEEDVAIKVFQQVVQNRGGLNRFRREMKLSRKLVHPNIVRIYEFGTWKGARFITMELLDGDDLESHMSRREGSLLPTSAALRLMIQACDGLSAAHEAGVIHRDVKPQNLFVIENGTRLKVMDFGIAKVNNHSAQVSVTGVRVGTPRYMSPEQIQGDATVSPASDLYALGGVMYEIFTGSPVFQEEDLVPLLLSHMTEPPERPSARRPDIPGDIEEIILRLLSKKPADRYESCAQLKQALVEAFVASQRG